MATFYNQATLVYAGGSLRSNVAAGELTAALSVTKTALSDTYSPGARVTYVVGIVNGGDNDLADVTLTDDLGAYTDATGSYVPLTYVPNSLHVFENGAPLAGPAPTVVTEPTFTVEGLSVPAGGDLLLVYEADVNAFAPPAAGSAIENTVTAASGGSTATASAIITRDAEPELGIVKSVSPETVSAGGRVTYTFEITNTGVSPADGTAAISVEDVFDPLLSDLAVSLDGAPLAVTTGYTYDAVSGAFATVPGAITVPAATVTRGTDGSYTVTPGTEVLTVEGTL